MARQRRLEAGRNVPLQDASRNRYPVAGPLVETISRHQEGRRITGARGGSRRKVGEIYERVHMYTRVGTHTTPLCLARCDCPIVTRDRQDRFHLWSHMLMIAEKERERDRMADSHRSSGLQAQVGKPSSQAARRNEESRTGIGTHINLHIFGPHPSTPGPRGNPRASEEPVRR